MDRLVKYGVPATVLHRQVDERDQIGRARQAAETVSEYYSQVFPLTDAAWFEITALLRARPVVAVVGRKLCVRSLAAAATAVVAAAG